MARLEKPSMLLKMPGMMAQGDFQPNLARIQKHRGQQSGRARMPRFLAEIRMNHFVGHVCEGGKEKRCQRGYRANQRSRFRIIRLMKPRPSSPSVPGSGIEAFRNWLGDNASSLMRNSSSQPLNPSPYVRLPVVGSPENQ